MDAKDVLKMRNITCECGCAVFEEREVLKVASKIMSPNGREEIIPISIMVCSSCGRPSKDFLRIAMGMTESDISSLLGEPGGDAPEKPSMLITK